MSNLLEAKALLVTEYFTGECGILKYHKIREFKYSVLKFNKRRFKNKEAVRWAISRGFLSYHPYERAWSLDWGKDIFAYKSNEPMVELLETEILWTILGETVKKYSGRSIIADQVWHKIGINPHGDRYHTDNDYQKQWQILTRLSCAGFIYFQSCADLWGIEVR